MKPIDLEAITQKYKQEKKEIQKEPTDTIRPARILQLYDGQTHWLENLPEEEKEFIQSGLDKLRRQVEQTKRQ